MKTFGIVALVSLCFVSCAVGTVTGTVRMATGPLPDAWEGAVGLGGIEVRLLTDPANELTGVQNTNTQGAYAFTEVPEGAYSLQAVMKRNFVPTGLDPVFGMGEVFSRRNSGGWTSIYDTWWESETAAADLIVETSSFTVVRDQTTVVDFYFNGY